MDVNSLSHTRWECKYHIVFAPKFRRKVAYGELKQDIANILNMLCKRKGVEIIEAEICPDHVHMLVRNSRVHCYGYIIVDKIAHLYFCIH